MPRYRHAFAPAAIKPTVAVADLDKLEIGVGTIERSRASRVPKSSLKLTVDFGDRR